MKLLAGIVSGLLLALLAVALVWRWASRRWTLPCPTMFSWMVDGSLVDYVSGTRLTLDSMRLTPGMVIVEIGPGAGRLLLPAARRVLPGGKAIGIELQSGMIALIRRKLEIDDPGNVELIHADVTQKVITPDTADLVYLCTVLGEIPDRAAALARSFEMLRTEGRLAITEIRGDPHYQSRAKVAELARAAGFEPLSSEGNWWMYTAQFVKPPAMTT